MPEPEPKRYILINWDTREVYSAEGECADAAVEQAILEFGMDPDTKFDSAFPVDDGREFQKLNDEFNCKRGAT